jgi:hypothetical protein
MSSLSKKKNAPRQRGALTSKTTPKQYFRSPSQHKGYYDIGEVTRRLPVERLLMKIGLFDREIMSGNYPCPLHNETKGESFNLNVEKGLWYCFGACARGGTGIDLLMRDGASFKEALARYAEYAGMTGTAAPYHAPRRQTPLVTVKKPSRLLDLPAIPEDVADVWQEGVKYLQDCYWERLRIAEWRHWPVAKVDFLAWNECISMPVCYGKRAVAFPVVTQVPEFRMIGFHARLEPWNEGERATWVYLPNEKANGQKTPSLPFIMGAANFSNARLIAIFGGQWDAITFAGAAGWLGEGRQWPEGVCVIAPRGDSGTKTFLEAYASIWPKNCNVLLFPDGDASGRRWNEGEGSFVEQLRKRGCPVAVVQTAPHKDFNDLYRAQEVTPEQIAALLAKHGKEVSK